MVAPARFLGPDEDVALLYRRLRCEVHVHARRIPLQDASACEHYLRTIRLSWILRLENWPPAALS
jgi:hypothetical protein